MFRFVCNLPAAALPQQAASWLPAVHHLIAHWWQLTLNPQCVTRDKPVQKPKKMSE